MKSCPTCNQTYADDTLNFCLSCGTVLSSAMGNQPTVAIPTPPQTTEPGFPATGPDRFVPPKKSRAWIWVLGIFGALILIGIIGIVGIAGLIAIYSDNSDQPVANNSSTDKGPTRTNILKDNFSKWPVSNNEYIVSEYKDAEFYITTKRTEYYYVFQSISADGFTTYNASTKVTVRNVLGKTCKYGYGLIIHGDANDVLARDYGFLIDSVTQMYKVVSHATKKETDVVKWAKLSAIRPGSQTNELQVIDEDGKMSFYVNGQMATTVRDTSGFKSGVAGIYASSAIPIAFSNLELKK